MTVLVFKPVQTLPEAEILRRIRNQCREYMTRHTGVITPEQQEEWFKTAYEKYDLYIAYAVEHGACVVDAGFGVIHKNEDEFLLTGGLVPDYRDKGLGVTLFKFLIDQCGGAGAHRPIRLEVLRNNTRAFRTYEKLGFEVTGGRDSIILMEYVYDSCI